MKIIAKNTNLMFKKNIVHFVNLAEQFSFSLGRSSHFEGEQLADGYKVSSAATAEAESWWAFPVFTWNTTAIDGKQYYVCFDMEMLHNDAPAQAGACVIKFNSQSEQGSFVYPNVGQRKVVGCMCIKEEGNGIGVQIIIQHGIKLPTNSTKGLVEYIIRAIAIISVEDSSFSSLEKCIDYLSKNGFNSVE